MFWPTPGRSDITGILNLERVEEGPIPETSRSCGLLTAPAESIISRVAVRK